VEFINQPSQYGYLAGLRRDGLDGELPGEFPGRGWWRPDDACELGLSDVGRVAQLEWIDCAGIRRVVWPNRLAWTARLVLAGQRVIDQRFGSG